MQTKYLITGAAGFIGFHLSKALLGKSEAVIGIDNLINYYDVSLKHARLKELAKYTDFQFVKMNIAKKDAMNELFKQNSFDIVCHFAAQAGIMYSTINPDAFIHSNIIGFSNVLECCKAHNNKLIYASSSRVYDDNKKLPFSENAPITMPKNLYAKTKINNEYLAQIYSDHIYNIGSSNPVSLLELIEELEKQLGIKVIKNFLPQRAEEIDVTFADISKLGKVIGYKPDTKIDEGISNFIEWYKTYLKLTLNTDIR